ncbi:MAG: RNA polymerase sigma factor [Bacillota bacterium]
MNYQMKELVQQCKQGDSKSKEMVLTALKPLILASINSYYFGSEPYEDLIQEGYLRILKEIERFDPHRGVPFLGYIKLQLKYLYFEKRREKKQGELSLDSLLEDNGISTFLDILPNGGVSVEDVLVQRDTRRQLREAMELLTEKQRKIIILYFLERQSMKAIAEQLEVHYQTVVRTKDRAIRTLRSCDLGW